MKCRNVDCGIEVADNALYCGKCGTPTISFCTACGAPIPANPDTKSCPNCGTMIMDMRNKAIPEPVTPETNPPVQTVFTKEGVKKAIKAIRFPKWYPIKAVTSLNWAVAIHPILCVFFFITSIFWFRGIVFFVRGIATGFSLAGLYYKKSWAFIVAAIIQSISVLILIAIGGFYGFIFTIGTTIMAVVGFIAYNQFKKNADAIYSEGSSVE